MQMLTEQRNKTTTKKTVNTINHKDLLNPKTFLLIVNCKSTYGIKWFLEFVLIDKRAES